MKSQMLQASEACEEAALPASSQSLAVAPVGSRDLLQSLDMAKRRCDNLNRELVRQAQSHEELVGALAAIKDANKRLLEQTQFQRDELETIAQQGVADEQRLQISSAKHANDRSSFVAESSRHLAAARDMASHRLASVKLRASEKFRTLQSCLNSAADSLTAEGTGVSMRRPARRSNCNQCLCDLLNP